MFRRALEFQDPRIVTIGFAGFFGLPLMHTAHPSDVAEAHLPVPRKPAVISTDRGAPDTEQSDRIAARALRA